MPSEVSKSRTRVVFVVFASVSNPETGTPMSRQILGIFENQKEADDLEARFNEEAQKREGASLKAFSLRYLLPYVAPLAKEIIPE
jgi:hypothetical protein